MPDKFNVQHYWKEMGSLRYKIKQCVSSDRPAEVELISWSEASPPWTVVRQGAPRAESHIQYFNMEVCTESSCMQTRHNGLIKLHIQLHSRYEVKKKKKNHLTSRSQGWKMRHRLSVLSWCNLWWLISFKKSARYECTEQYPQPEQHSREVAVSLFMFMYSQFCVEISSYNLRSSERRTSMAALDQPLRLCSLYPQANKGTTVPDSRQG